MALEVAGCLPHPRRSATKGCVTAPDWLCSRPIAHRGLHDRDAGRPENTLSAADAAIGGGFAVECDVQITADGEAVVFHDHDLGRLTGAAGLVRDRSAADLGRLAVSGSADTIPTLAAFLDRVGGRTPVVVEIKSRFDGDERLARRTAEVIVGRPGPIAAKSFDPAIVTLMRRIAPGIPRGIVAQSGYDEGETAGLPVELKREMANLLHWNETEPDFLSWRQADLPSAAPFLARRLGGVPVMTWTIRSAEAATRVRPHADQIVFEGFRPG